MTAPILTLTMNPALDLSTSVPRVAPEEKLRCAPARFDPGGGGVNVSRAIRSLGGDSRAIYPLGGPTGEAFRRLAADEGLTGEVVTIAESTRENLAVTDASTGQQFRFVLPGPQLSESEWRACLSAVVDNLPRGGYLVASGSLPPGVPEDFYGVLARTIAGADVRLVIDAAGPALAHALDEGVFLIKPSRDEFAELIGDGPEMTDEQRLDGADGIIRAGRAEVVALTMGAEGALLVSAAGAIRLPTPAVPVASAVGAGDAFLAGVVLRLAEGRSLADAFRTAVAAGSATAMIPGTGLCRVEDVARLEESLSARR
ncbi:1-phosphofructokinase family hexose kinase [Microbacterium sp. SYP-A9085]|uniref:1-phosphofructokinase family hexose kinase n=1 Tax=Microbacterium sp. SYP-A9085 TaxID=2664454 RepID=UPI0034645345